MAAKSSTLLLVLVVVGAAQAVAPLPCQGDPTSRCQDTAMATRCSQEQQRQDLWDSLALGDEADRDDVGRGRRIKCSLCTKALKKIQTLAGDDPDEAAVTAALKKGCRLLGRFLGRQCQKLVNQYQDQISQGLQNGDTPRDICTTMGICKA
ncbi:saposin-C-like [Pipra filicauda]|uniref:Saposin-C-like n=1 Tax=Pipra filicauda TaxID=649802 RepID=A0A6J2HU37_9PASS|nr:saposin-C-like [Pipra filicauda]XP_039242323.1 saposin-C-like [Pipra filicauda]